MCGSDGTVRFHGRGYDRQLRRFDLGGRAHRPRRRDHHRRTQAGPRSARRAKHWAVENNIYQLGHRGLTAVAGGAGDCPYTFMQDLVAGRYQACRGRTRWSTRTARRFGFAKPTRRYGEAPRTKRRSEMSDDRSRPLSLALQRRSAASKHRASSSSTCRPISAAIGGYVDKMGYDLSLTRAPIEPIKALLEAMRGPRAIYVIHTREGHRPDLSDLPAQQALALAPHGRGHRRRRAPAARSWCAARPGWEIIPDLAPIAPGEIVIDKPGKGSFCATDLELILRTKQNRKHRADRHHHRCLRAYDDARGQRPRLRMRAAGGLLRRDRSRQPSRRRSRW